MTQSDASFMNGWQIDVFHMKHHVLFGILDTHENFEIFLNNRYLVRCSRFE